MTDDHDFSSQLKANLGEIIANKTSILVRVGQEIGDFRQFFSCEVLLSSNGLHAGLHSITAPLQRIHLGQDLLDDDAVGSDMLAIAHFYETKLLLMLLQLNVCLQLLGLHSTLLFPRGETFVGFLLQQDLIFEELKFRPHLGISSPNLQGGIVPFSCHPRRDSHRGT